MLYCNTRQETGTELVGADKTVSNERFKKLFDMSGALVCACVCVCVCVLAGEV